MVHPEIEKIATLRQAVEHRLGRSVNTPSEFKLLSDDIKHQSNISISQSTLMRIWGYVTSNVRPSETILNSLAVYAGYHDFESFGNGDGKCSDVIVSLHINVDTDLAPRDHVLVRWSGDHEILVRYLGEAQFVVERSINSKLSVGDTFTCHLIIQNQPLYLDNFVHQTTAPHCYVCGRNNGIRFEVIKADNI